MAIGIIQEKLNLPTVGIYQFVYFTFRQVVILTNEYHRVLKTK